MAVLSYYVRLVEVRKMRLSRVQSLRQKQFGRKKLCYPSKQVQQGSPDKAVWVKRYPNIRRSKLLGASGELHS